MSKIYERGVVVLERGIVKWEDLPAKVQAAKAKIDQKELQWETVIYTECAALIEQVKAIAHRLDVDGTMHFLLDEAFCAVVYSEKREIYIDTDFEPLVFNWDTVKEWVNELHGKNSK